MFLSYFLKSFQSNKSLLNNLIFFEEILLSVIDYNLKKIININTKYCNTSLSFLRF